MMLKSTELDELHLKKGRATGGRFFAPMTCVNNDRQPFSCPLLVSGLTTLKKTLTPESPLTSRASYNLGINLLNQCLMVDIAYTAIAKEPFQILYDVLKSADDLFPARLR